MEPIEEAGLGHPPAAVLLLGAGDVAAGAGIADGGGGDVEFFGGFGRSGCFLLFFGVATHGKSYCTHCNTS